MRNNENKVRFWWRIDNADANQPNSIRNCTMHIPHRLRQMLRTTRLSMSSKHSQTEVKQSNEESRCKHIEHRAYRSTLHRCNEYDFPDFGICEAYGYGESKEKDKYHVVVIIKNDVKIKLMHIALTSRDRNILQQRRNKLCRMESAGEKKFK